MQSLGRQAFVRPHQVSKSARISDSDEVCSSAICRTTRAFEGLNSAAAMEPSLSLSTSALRTACRGDEHDGLHRAFRPRGHGRPAQAGEIVVAKYRRNIMVTMRDGDRHDFLTICASFAEAARALCATGETSRPTDRTTDFTSSWSQRGTRSSKPDRRRAPRSASQTARSPNRLLSSSCDGTRR